MEMKKEDVKCVTFSAGSMPMPTFVGFQTGNICIDNDGFHFGVIYNSPETMPKEANTHLYVEDGKVRLAIYKNGHRLKDIELIDGIADIQVLNKKVVIVTFTDGDTKKAILDTYDTFNIEQGIAICIMKKYFSKISNGNGSSVYNKLVEYGMKTYNEIFTSKSKSEVEKQENEAKEKRNADKAKRKREKKAAKKREAEIEIHKEAYLRAMREFNDTSNTAVEK